MRNLVTVCAALVVILGIVSGNMWRELRSARQQIGELQSELAQAKVPVVQSPPAQALPQAPPVTTGAPPAPALAAQLPESRPLPSSAPLYPPVSPAPPAQRPERVIVFVPTPAPERPAGLPTLTQPLVGTNPEERRIEALAQSDRTAKARATQWSTVLNLTPEQLQVLNDTAMTELRRETEESLQIASRTGPLDAQGTARLKVETVTRQYETLTRIVDRMTPQLAPEQSTRMRTMFQNWLATNMTRARMEEQAALSGR